MPETPNPLAAVMQATERLRRFFDTPEDIDVTWPGRPAYVDELDWMSQRKEEDTKKVLSILPKGERPVPMEWTGDTAVYFTTLEFDGGSPVPGYWDVDENDEPQVWSPFVEGPVRSKLYRTQEDAQLAIRWAMFDKLTAADAPLLT